MENSTVIFWDIFLMRNQTFAPVMNQGSDQLTGIKRWTATLSQEHRNQIVNEVESVLTGELPAPTDVDEHFKYGDYRVSLFLALTCVKDFDDWVFVDRFLKSLSISDSPILQSKLAMHLVDMSVPANKRKELWHGLTARLQAYIANWHLKQNSLQSCYEVIAPVTAMNYAIAYFGRPDNVSFLLWNLQMAESEVFLKYQCDQYYRDHAFVISFLRGYLYQVESESEAMKILSQYLLQLNTLDRRKLNLRLSYNDELCGEIREKFKILGI